MLDDINNLEENVVPEMVETPSHAQELVSCKEQLLRVSADFQNFRKRTEKERVDWAITAQGAVINKMLPIIEDLERALAATAHDGLSLIHKNLKKILTELGVEEIQCSGVFNPELHEALTQVDAPEVDSGSIVQVYAQGYLFKGTVLRHAKVAVAK